MTGLLSYMLPHRGVQWELAKSPSVPQLAIREQLDREMSYDGSHPRQQEQEAINAFRGYGPQMLMDAFIPGYGAGGDAKAASEAYGEGRYGAAAGNALMAAMDFVPVLGALPAAAKGIRAFHGSPHDFDRFDMSKIGTGEGAQAYGHGLYFADNEEVAKAYRDSLTTYSGAPRLFTKDGAEPVANTTPEKYALQYLGQANGDYGKVAAELGTADFPDRIKQDLLSALKKYESEGVTFRQPGRMYEVNINADPEAFLDWDKPLSEQPAKVQDVFREFGATSGYTGEEAWRRAHGSNHFALVDNQWVPADSKASALQMVGGDETKIYAAATGDLPSRAAALREAGIPGIKYLDAGSRTLGDGSRNYVVFDDRLITILRKYGIGGLIAGGGAYALTDAEYAQAAELLAQDGMNTGGGSGLRPFSPGERRENPDGSYSTEITATEYLPDGTIANFPTLWMGPNGPVELQLEDAMQAVTEYERTTGQKFPRFNSIEEAVMAARSRSQGGGATNSPLARGMNTRAQ